MQNNYFHPPKQLWLFPKNYGFFLKIMAFS
jgi:hypothetical protein